MERTFRLFDFNVYTKNEQTSDEESGNYQNSASFMIQMFGIDETGKSACILVENFKPFFYVMVDDSWTISTKSSFETFLKVKLGKYYENSVTECKIIKRKKLYVFDGGN